ncbi:hypothetical protein [Magnetofaba australis]|nr:hypothetical protein [Magnetofaba australis]
MKQLHPVIRDVTETCYQHINLSRLGNHWPFKNKYIEGLHSPKVASPRQSDFDVKFTKRVPNWAFDLYESTLTGEHTANVAGSNAFKQTSILVLLAVFAFSVAYPAYIYNKRQGETDVGVSTADDGHARDLLVDAQGAAVGVRGGAGRLHQNGAVGDPLSRDVRADAVVRPLASQYTQTPPFFVDAVEIFWRPEWRASSWREYRVDESGAMTNVDPAGAVILIDKHGGRLQLRAQFLDRYKVTQIVYAPCVRELLGKDGWRKVISCEPEFPEPKKQEEPTESTQDPKQGVIKRDPLQLLMGVGRQANQAMRSEGGAASPSAERAGAMRAAEAR